MKVERAAEAPASPRPSLGAVGVAGALLMAMTVSGLVVYKASGALKVLAKTEAEGKAQKTAGKIQNAVGGVKDSLRGDK